MMDRYVKAMQEFHEKYNLPSNNNLESSEFAELLNFRFRLAKEEYKEFKQAVKTFLYCDQHPTDAINLLDALGDLFYVLVGTAVSFDIPLDLLFERIHESNMTKDVAINGKPSKGPDYRPPVLGDLVKARRGDYRFCDPRIAASKEAVEE